MQSHVTRGSVLDDLGLTEEEVTEARIKANLWRDLVAHIKSLKLTQKEMAKRLGIHQPEVSSLLNGKLSKFSAGTLIHYAVVLNMDVAVKLTAPKQKRRVVKALSGVCALAFVSVAHAQGTMSFSGAHPLTGTSQISALYAVVAIWLGSLIFAETRPMPGGFQDAISALFGSLRQNGLPFAGADICKCPGLYRPELPTSARRVEAGVRYSF